MSRSAQALALLILTVVALTGCNGGSGDLPKEQDKDLRNNFSRALTPEEVAQMGGSKTTEGAAPPKKSKG